MTTVISQELVLCRLHCHECRHSSSDCASKIRRTTPEIGEGCGEDVSVSDSGPGSKPEVR